MARRARAASEDDEENTSGSLFVRTLVWAGIAAIALGGAALVAQSHTGTARLAQILEGSAPLAAPSAPLAARPAESSHPAIRPADSDLDSRRLAEAVRTLAADRDRLLARVETLERNLEVTGSIPQENPVSGLPAFTSSQPSLPPSWSLVPSTIPPAAGMPAAGIQASPMATIPAPAASSGRGAGGLTASEQGAESVATRTEFAVDVGGDPSLEGLRALWTSLKTTHAALLEGLRPVVAIRDGARPGAVELRLVAGPLTNAGAAARLCASLAASGLTCQPTVFDGQRLALR